MASENDSEVLAHKTGRITILALLVALLGGLFFAYKIDACKAKPEDLMCREEFFEFKSGTDGNSRCRPGAVIEVVNSPPSLKAGIMCHCPGTPASPSAPAKP